MLTSLHVILDPFFLPQHYNPHVSELKFSRNIVANFPSNAQLGYVSTCSTQTKSYHPFFEAKKFSTSSTNGQSHNTLQAPLFKGLFLVLVTNRRLC